jgi:hypothetical protein
LSYEFFICRRCLSISPSLDDANTFDKKSYTWSNTAGLTKEELENHYLQNKFYLNSIIDKIPEDIALIVDFGCGPGYLLEAARRLTKPAIGIEINDDNARVCRLNGHTVFTGNYSEVIESEQFINSLANANGRVLFLFKNSLIYNRDAVNLLKKFTSCFRIGDFLCISEQCYGPGARHWQSFLSSSSAGKMKYVMSPLTLKILAPFLGLEHLYSPYLKQYFCILRKKYNQNKMEEFSKFSVSAIILKFSLVLAHIDSILHRVRISLRRTASRS